MGSLGLAALMCLGFLRMFPAAYVPVSAHRKAFLLAKFPWLGPALLTMSANPVAGLLYLSSCPAPASCPCFLSALPLPRREAWEWEEYWLWSLTDLGSSPGSSTSCCCDLGCFASPVRPWLHLLSRDEGGKRPSEACGT